jgi:hypothetical protein
MIVTLCTRIKKSPSPDFTQELQLLNKGLQYNLHHKPKNWIETLALEAETVINKLEATEQQHYRQESNNHNNTRNKTEWKLITKIENKLTITKADKGRTIVILM